MDAFEIMLSRGLTAKVRPYNDPDFLHRYIAEAHGRGNLNDGFVDQVALNKALSESIVVSLGQGEEEISGRDRIFEILSDPSYYELRDELIAKASLVQAEYLDLVDNVRDTMVNFVVSHEKWRVRHSLPSESYPNLAWHEEVSREIGKPTPCLLEMPRLPFCFRNIMRLFTTMWQSQDFSMQAFKILHPHCEILEFLDFTHVILSMKGSLEEIHEKHRKL